MKWVNKFRSCGQLRIHLWEYATGVFQASASDPAVARIEAHLAHCPDCRAEVEGFRAAASAMAAYSSTPEVGIPPRAPDWESVQARLGETARVKTPATAGIPLLRALRTSPAFAGAAVSLGVCTTLCAIAIPWALNDKHLRQAEATSRGAARAPVGTIRSASVEPASVEPAAVVPVRTNAPVEMIVRPVFNGTLSLYGTVGQSARGTFPLAVRLVNKTGQAVKARLTAAHRGALAEHRYERAVLLSADSKPQTVLLYPSVDGAFSLRPELQVTLNGPFPSQETRITVANYHRSEKMMALIGDEGPGALFPKQQVMDEHRKAVGRRKRINGRVAEPNYYVRYLSSSSKPEIAPDRPAGYDSVDTVVVGHGAERLRLEQRTALRQWVIGGGSVIVLPGADLDLLGIQPNAPYKKVSPVPHLLAPETPLRRYSLGIGAVLTVGADLTQPWFRERWELPYVWDTLRSRAAPLIPSDELKQIGNMGAAQTQHSDPFQVALPPLTTVVYLFTGYFLLAVPVTFMLLKRTGRMNWAWATGPALAAVFGGVVYGFTAELHKAKLSRRTGGMLISVAGDKQARFVGTSEIFFPAAGRYDVTVPGAETINFGLGRAKSSSVSSGGESISPPRDSITVRSLETVDNGISVAVPELAVPNLSFRRLSHAQPIDWGEGISVDLKLTDNNRLVGTIYNRTGRTLANAYVFLQTSARRAKLPDKRVYVRHLRSFVVVKQVAPGVTRLDQQVSLLDTESVPRLSDVSIGDAERYSSLFYSRGTEPILVATTSGKDLGPTIGQYVGGSDAVTVAVTLPPILPAVHTAVKGGSK